VAGQGARPSPTAEAGAFAGRRPAAPGREGLQLGFGAVDAQEIRRGVRELAAVFEDMARPVGNGGAG